MDIFTEWHSTGTQLRWRSTTTANNDAEVSVFTRRSGTPGAPALVLVHGFPTSSIDYFGLAGELGSEFDIFVLDFPGYGLSDKPSAPYVYSLYDDARLLVHAIRRVWQLTEFRMLTHDRGSSVGMIALGMLAGEDPAALPLDVIITNANIYLPLSNLTTFQTALLDAATGGPLPPRRRPSCWRPAWEPAPSSRGGRWTTRRSPRWRSALPTTTGFRCCPTPFSTFMSGRPTKPAGLNSFPRYLSTPRWCGDCTTTWRRCASPTMSGRRI
ncbi:alpha/beta hydrolase family protein [Mycobacterium kansasii 732]|nr:alpha/beta hydrolase family protein [Mycobacterium kansasii 732]